MEKLGRMSKIDLNIFTSHRTYYFPQHAVIKDSSITTKLRMVFDASAKSPWGLSLNTILMAGAAIQENLFAIITRFRKRNIVTTAYVTKIYHQGNIKKDQ